ncbi:MAG TPA: peptide-methionine (R)-S-oxide reductase MsrB [Rhodocyclaceae bacterium]|nr:peptide-methionine (R)-S-oxide reductase MsrB [Rhodocyclaceae bacterium]
MSKKPSIVRSEDEWRNRLTPLQYKIAREKGTEAPFSGRYWDCHEQGLYRCACCDQPLFDSSAKFDSSCGWPSFSGPIVAASLTEIEDLSHNMQRIEVVCTHCGAHLGHVFPDGPAPSGLRYCINSAVIALQSE